MNVRTENRQTFFNRLNDKFDKEDLQLIEFAYDLSKEAHRVQKRDGGERYFEHPRAGCLIILDELELYDRDMVISFLLHDVGEDTPLLGNRKISYEKFKDEVNFRLVKTFGDRVAKMVLKLTKPAIENICFHNKIEAFEFYINKLKESPDAIVLKMVDRLHNLRSLPVDKPSWVKKQLDETELVYMPIFTSVTGEMEKYAKALVSKIRFEITRLGASL